ncbi:type II secretion system major pseudopilin GspG [Breznakiella homolactica]|uniref:Type II secretion system major pseudopilin GspG n=1 Tax=Breznakiella homolactica TaxID=2798577 RepID=A0A7T8BCZ3_9SPIR|nr:type II secretion system major pseudopilin GspG [Breznakiella homolactica]QQO10743.1 type II secretion system major pseudopilin GspG [Breznakiella homolactica]
MDTENNSNPLYDGGWTFMETLIVIAIVLILTSSVGFMAIQYLDKARIATARSQIDSFSIALESYYIDCGRYPTTEQGLAALWQKPSVEPSSANWSGPYMYKNVPKDPWGNDYEYLVPGQNNLPYSIRSFGADGREGGEKNDADITSWSD